MMKVADVTGVAWQQMCVSSWQGSAASSVSGGGWTYSSILGARVSLYICIAVSFRLLLFLLLSLTDSRCQQMPLYTERNCLKR